MIDNKTFTLVGAFKDDITPSLRKITKGIADLTKGFDKLQSKLRPMSKDMGVLAMSLDRVATSFQAQRVSLESNVRVMAEYRREAGKMVAANKAVANSANKIRQPAKPKGGGGGRPYSPPMPPSRAPLQSTTQKSRSMGAHGESLTQRRGSDSEPKGTKRYAGGSVVGDVVSGGLITSAIVSGFQMGANIIEGAFQKFANAFTERVGDQIEDIASAGGIFTGAKSAGLTAFGNSIDDAMSVQKELNRSMATLAADLPGTTNDFVQNARSITDTVMTAMSKQPQQFVKSVGEMTGLKNLDEKSAFIEAIKGLAESTTMLEKLAPGSGTTMTMLFEDMMSQDQINAKSMQRRYSQMRRNPTLVAALERNQKEINKYAAGTTERMLAISKALKQAVPPEMVNTMKRSVSGVIESFKSNFTDPDTGLFGLSRQLNFSVRQFDSVTGRLKEGATEAVGIFDIMADIIGGFGVVFNSSILPAMLNAFMPFNEMGLSLVNLREYSWKLFETIQSSTAFFKNVAESNNMDPAKFQAGFRGGLDTMAAILSTFGAISKGQLASIESRLQSPDADLKGIGQEVLNAFMGSKFVNWLTEFAGMIVGKFFSAIADMLDNIVAGVDAIADTGFAKGFQEAGGSSALERIMVSVFHLIAKAILKSLEVSVGALAMSIQKGDWGAAAGLGGMLALITIPFHGMIGGLFGAAGQAIGALGGGALLGSLALPAAIVAILAGIVIFQKQIKDFAWGVMQWGNNLSKSTDWLTSSFGFMMEGLGQVIHGLTNFFAGWWDVIVGLITGDSDKLIAGIKKMFTGIGYIIVGVVNTVGGFGGIVTSAVGNLFKAIGGVFDRLRQRVENLITYGKFEEDPKNKARWNPNTSKTEVWEDGKWGAMAFGSSNPFMGNLGSAIQFEQQNKPSGSHLIVANSSETVIPAARGYGAGVGDLIEAIGTQTFYLSRTIDLSSSSLASSVVLGLKSQVSATVESTNRIIKGVDKSIRVETDILKIVEIFRMENYNNLQSIISSNTRPPGGGGGGGGGGVSAGDEQVGQWADIINSVAAEVGVPAELIAKVMKQESGGRSNQTSSSGAKGLMQLKEGTASDLGVTNIWDPEQNIRGGAKYLKQMLELSGGDEKKALAKYNQGPNATPAALAGTGATYANEVLGQRVTTSPSGQVAGAGTFLGRPISPGLTDALNMARGMGFADPTPNQFVGGGHAPGGLHPQGRAMDFSGDTIKMTQLAATLARTNPAQLIWSGPGPQSMASGQHVDPIEYWGQATWSNHRDHVHVGYGFGPGSPAFFSTQDQALKWERSMAPRNAAIASVTSNSSEFRGGGSHTFNNNINITTRPDQNPQDIADTVLYELERRVATVRSSSLFFS